ncbi:MAG TPA: hypothetical protein VFQ85_06195 [Mycobacteriales bacterium]|nr:hypothetical protein [Mycobacteriales bacterium]
MRELPLEGTEDPEVLREWASDSDVCFMPEDEELVVPSWTNLPVLLQLAGEGLAQSSYIASLIVPHFLRSEALGGLTDRRGSPADLRERLDAVKHLVPSAGDYCVDLVARIIGYTHPAPFDHDRAVEAGHDLSCCHWDLRVLAAPQRDGGWTVTLNKGTLLIDAEGTLAWRPPDYVITPEGRVRERRGPVRTRHT